MSKKSAIKLKPLDVVRTKFGTVAVVSEVSRGQASLSFAEDTSQKIAWYTADELVVIGNVIDMVNEQTACVI
jgi:hypothetical protein